MAQTGIQLLLILAVLYGYGSARKMLVINDVHFNPCYSSERGVSCHCFNFNTCNVVSAPAPNSHLLQMGCDPSGDFVRMAINAARQYCPNPELLLVLGDCGHRHLGKQVQQN